MKTAGASLDACLLYWRCPLGALCVRSVRSWDPVWVGTRLFDTNQNMLYVTSTRLIASDLLRLSIGLYLVSRTHACIIVFARPSSPRWRLRLAITLVVVLFGGELFVAFPIRERKDPDGKERDG